MRIGILRIQLYRLPVGRLRLLVPAKPHFETKAQFVHQVPVASAQADRHLVGLNRLRAIRARNAYVWIQGVTQVFASVRHLCSAGNPFDSELVDSDAQPLPSSMRFDRGQAPKATSQQHSHQLEGGQFFPAPSSNSPGLRLQPRNPEGDIITQT